MVATLTKNNLRNDEEYITLFGIMTFDDNFMTVDVYHKEDYYWDPVLKKTVYDPKGTKRIARFEELVKNETDETLKSEYEKTLAQYREDLKVKKNLKGRYIRRVLGQKSIDNYIAQYKDDAEVQNNAKKFKQYLNNVKDFKNHIDKTEIKDKNGNVIKDKTGTYDIETFEKIENLSGVFFTFHQNKAVGNEYGYYDDEKYAQMVAITMKETGATKAYIGYYGNPEISFCIDDFDKALEFCEMHNQDSAYNSNKDINAILGKGDYKEYRKRNPKYNVIKRKGDNYEI